MTADDIENQLRMPFVSFINTYQNGIYRHTVSSTSSISSLPKPGPVATGNFLKDVANALDYKKSKLKLKQRKERYYDKPHWKKKGNIP